MIRLELSIEADGTQVLKEVEYPEYTPPEPTLDELTLLKAQNKALADRLEFAEDLIAELAGIAYA